VQASSRQSTEHGDGSAAGFGTGRNTFSRHDVLWLFALMTPAAGVSAVSRPQSREPAIRVLSYHHLLPLTSLLTTRSAEDCVESSVPQAGRYASGAAASDPDYHTSEPEEVGGYFPWLSKG